MNALVEEVRRRQREPSRGEWRRIRHNAGVSQERLAAELGVHPVTVARWEIGSRRPRGRLRDAYIALLTDLERVVGK